MAPTADQPRSIVVIGAGEAGIRAALTLRAEGFEGAVTIVGDEAHAPYDRPPLSKAILSSGADRPPAPAGADALAGMAIDLLGGTEAASIDRATRRVALRDGRHLRYDRLLLATGAKARRLTVEGEAHALTLRSLDDAMRLRGRLAACESIVVIGGGFIGLEVAAAARGLGIAVSVVEAAPRILGRAVPEPIAAIVEGWHRAAGVEILTAAPVARIEGEGSARAVHLSDGRRLEADLVVAGVGAEPETTLAAAAGLTVDNGIIVDRSLRTSDPSIHAAGDCARFPHPLGGDGLVRLEAWRNAQDQGAFVARAMLGCDDAYSAVPWFWSDQYDMTLQVAGLAPGDGTSIVRRLDAGAAISFHLDREGRLLGAAAAGPLALVAKDIRLAEKLIAAGARPDLDRLADPGAALKSFLRAA